jgi:hypothetical protein
MTSPPETIQPAQSTQPSRRALSALVTAGLLLLLAGALVYLVVLMQPFADASGGCGGG